MNLQSKNAQRLGQRNEMQVGLTNKNEAAKEEDLGYFWKKTPRSYLHISCGNYVDLKMGGWSSSVFIEPLILADETPVLVVTVY
jgi:hypothetical protein